MIFRIIVSQYAVFETAQEMTYGEFFKLIIPVYLKYREDKQNFLATLSNIPYFKMRGMLPSSTENGALVIKNYKNIPTMHILFGQKRITMSDNNTDFFFDLNAKYTSIALFYNDRVEYIRQYINNANLILETYQKFAPETAQAEEKEDDFDYSYNENDFAEEQPVAKADVPLEDMLPPEEVLTNKAAARIARIDSISEKTIDLNDKSSVQAMPLSDDMNISAIADEIMKMA